VTVLGVTAGVIQMIIRVGGAVGSALGIVFVGDATSDGATTRGDPHGRAG
jgi:hypothetical protein